MFTRITTEMRKGKSSAEAGGPDLHNRKPYRDQRLKAEARREAFRPNKGKFRGTTVSHVTRLYHGSPKVHQDLTNG